MHVLFSDRSKIREDPPKYLRGLSLSLFNLSSKEIPRELFGSEKTNRVNFVLVKISLEKTLLESSAYVSLVDLLVGTRGRNILGDVPIS